LDKIEIDRHALLYSRENALNIEIRPLDTITVTKADIVYVVGEVHKAGGFVLEDRESVSVLQVLAMAEGLKYSAAKGKTLIMRRGTDGSTTKIRVNVSRILSGKAEDMTLAANDILFVPASGPKNAAVRGTEAAYSVLNTLIIYNRF
jgi:polysaccharide export outer membrane protein